MKAKKCLLFALSNIATLGISTLNAQPKSPADASSGVLIAANVLLGAITAAVPNAVRHRPVMPALLRGGVGGLGGYAGKKILSNEGSLAGWIGRQLAALAASEIRNAELGKPTFDEWLLPLGPIRVYAKPRQRRVRGKLDLAAVITSAAFAARGDTRLNWGESLRNGSIVFNRPYKLIDVGSHVAGVIRIEDIPPDLPRYGVNNVRPAVLAHETIHASQNDFVFIVWAQPIESALLDKKGFRGAIHRYVDFGVGVPVWLGVSSSLRYRDRPWEKEAGHLAPGW